MRYVITIVVLIALTPALVAQEGERKLKMKRGAPEENYVGVAVKPVPAELVAHLETVLAKGTGVIVTRVVPSSPAAASSVRKHDILVSYAGTAIASRQQLKKLIVGAPRGQRVVIGVVRAGKLQEFDVALARRTIGRVGVLARGGTTSQISIAQSYMSGGVGRIGPVVIFSLDASRLQVRVMYLEDSNAPRNRVAAGLPTRILEQLGDLPPDVLAEVRRRLDETLQFKKGTTVASFRMRPYVNPRQQSMVRVTVSTLRKNGCVTMRGFSAAPEAEAIIAGLRGLEPAVRESLEKAVRKATIPRIEVKVDESL